MEEKLKQIITEIETIQSHYNDWDADDMEEFSQLGITWNGCEDTIGIELIYPYLKQLQLKDNELQQLNQARDEICASGQADYIGIIRDKNIELQLKDKMIELMAKKLLKFGMGKYYSDKTILMFYKQQALKELER